MNIQNDFIDNKLLKPSYLYRLVKVVFRFITQKCEYSAHTRVIDCIISCN